MARKSGDAPGSHNGLNDVLGIALLALALLVLVAQVSFDRYDLASVRVPPNKEIHNLIGVFGAQLAGSSFWLLGVPAYLLPLMLAAFGITYLTGVLGYLREHLWRSVLWSALLLFCLTGLLHILDLHNLAGNAREHLQTPSAGGFIGMVSYQHAFRLLGPGAVIVYGALGLISLLFLTNFQLGLWVRALWSLVGAKPGDELKTVEEIALEKRARELEKQKRRLEEEVGRTAKSEKAEKTASGLGAGQRTARPQNHLSRSAQGPHPQSRRGGRGHSGHRSARRRHRRHPGPQIRSHPRWRGGRRAATTR